MTSTLWSSTESLNTNSNACYGSYTHGRLVCSTPGTDAKLTREATSALTGRARKTTGHLSWIWLLDGNSTTFARLPSASCRSWRSGPSMLSYSHGSTTSVAGGPLRRMLPSASARTRSRSMRRDTWASRPRCGSRSCGKGCSGECLHVRTTTTKHPPARRLVALLARHRHIRAVSPASPVSRRTRVLASRRCQGQKVCGSRRAGSR